MNAFIPPRLRKPAVYALAGVLFAAAWLVRGGPLWWVSIPALIGTATVVARLYRLGGSDTDEGARAGSRPDERQRLVGLRSRALAGYLAAVASFTGLSVAVAVDSTWMWPFLITFLITGYGYLLGLGNYGIAEEGTPDDADTAGLARPPVRT